jgi:hypothetical protein
MLFLIDHTNINDDEDIIKSNIKSFINYLF